MFPVFFRASSLRFVPFASSRVVNAQRLGVLFSRQAPMPFTGSPMHGKRTITTLTGQRKIEAPLPVGCGPLSKRGFSGSPSGALGIRRNIKAQLALRPLNITHERENGSSSGKGLNFLLALGLLAVLAKFKKVHAEERSDVQLDRIKVLLKKDSEKRTVEESLELFNYLVMRGEEEANKAEGKNVVIFFGETGAGKSTLINFLYGCKMKVWDQKIVVDPNSPIKEVAEIGAKAVSSTFVPQKIPDYLPTGFIGRKHVLTFYDMPGLSDNRGIEVALANAIAMKQIVSKAKSVRFVMVFEYGSLNPVRGEKWKQAVKLLSERFDGMVEILGKSLCLVISQTDKDTGSIKEEIEKYEETSGSAELSKCITVYDPLNPTDINTLLNLIFQTKVYPQESNTKITMSPGQLWDAKELGEKIQADVAGYLKQQDMVRAVKAVRFTHGLTKLGNGGLNEPHKAVEDTVRKHTTPIIRVIDSKVAPSLPTRIEAFREYMLLRDHLGRFVSFKESDAKVRKKIELADKRIVSWEKPYPTGILATITAVSGVGGFFFLPLFAVTAISGGYTAWAGRRWLKPSEEESKEDFFYAGLKS